jgi:hypothetical protein
MRAGSPQAFGHEARWAARAGGSRRGVVWGAVSSDSQFAGKDAGAWTAGPGRDATGGGP